MIAAHFCRPSCLLYEWRRRFWTAPMYYCFYVINIVTHSKGTCNIYSNRTVRFWCNVLTILLFRSVVELRYIAINAVLFQYTLFPKTSLTQSYIIAQYLIMQQYMIDFLQCCLHLIMSLINHFRYSLGWVVTWKQKYVIFTLSMHAVWISGFWKFTVDISSLF